MLARRPGWRDLTRFLQQLGSPTRMSALRAGVDGMVVARTLKRRGVRPLLSSGWRVPGPYDPERVRRVSAAVDSGFGVVPMAPTCLRRSLTLLRELRRLGLAGSVHIGVRKVEGGEGGEGRVEAHAWVQVGEIVVNDDPTLTAIYTELVADDLERLPARLR